MNQLWSYQVQTFLCFNGENSTFHTNRHLLCLVDYQAKSCKHQMMHFRNHLLPPWRKPGLWIRSECTETCPNCYLVFLLEGLFWIPLQRQILRNTAQGVYFLHRSITIPSPSLFFPEAFRFWQYASFFLQYIQLPGGSANIETQGCN